MGTLVLSLDAELAWGFHDRDPEADRIRGAREAWDRLLDLLDAHDAPATWAVVGHLLADDCDGGHAFHPAGAGVCQRPVGDGRHGGSVRPGRAWHADGLVEAVRSADAGHEVGAHGFTHVHFRHETMSRPRASRELERTRETASDRGLDPTAFVFPVNEVRYPRLLADHGFACYRGRAPVASASGVGRRVRKAAGALADVGTPPVVHPYVDDHGLVNVPASMYLFDGVGPLRSVVDLLHGDPVVGRAVRGLEAVAGTDGVLHLWLHPHNVETEADYERLRAILSAAGAYRARGELTVETMGEVAASVREGSA